MNASRNYKFCHEPFCTCTLWQILQVNNYIDGTGILFVSSHAEATEKKCVEWSIQGDWRTGIGQGEAQHVRIACLHDDRRPQPRILREEHATKCLGHSHRLICLYMKQVLGIVEAHET